MCHSEHREESRECPYKYQPLTTDNQSGSEALPPRGVGYELKVSVANGLTPQSDTVATSPLITNHRLLHLTSVLHQGTAF